VAEGNGQIETGKDRGFLLLAWALTLLLGGLDWIWAGQLGLVFVGWLRVSGILIFLITIGFAYGYSGRSRRLSDASNYAALWVAFSAAGAISTYLVATLVMPLRDAEFVAIDAAMRFHWLAWYRFIEAHRVLQLPLFIAYFTFLPQIIGSILYFAHTGQTSRNAEMILIAMLSLIVTTTVSAFLPAVGPYVHFFGRQTEDIVVLMSLRAGGAHTFVTNRLQGIITFPSFHTVLAIIFMYVHRPPSRSFVPVAVLNVLMLLAIPSEGHHYLIDLISGALVAAVCIAVVRAVMRPRADLVTRDISRQQTARVAG
jgi:membrane-associated phospholipid phosphatase